MFLKVGRHMMSMQSVVSLHVEKTYSDGGDDQVPRMTGFCLVGHWPVMGRLTIWSTERCEFRPPDDAIRYAMRQLLDAMSTEFSLLKQFSPEGDIVPVSEDDTINGAIVPPEVHLG